MRLFGVFCLLRFQTLMRASWWAWKPVAWACVAKSSTLTSKKSGKQRSAMFLCNWINPAATYACPAWTENEVQWKHTTEADSDPTIFPHKYEISCILTNFVRIAGVHNSWKRDLNNQSFRQPIKVFPAWLKESCQPSTKITIKIQRISLNLKYILVISNPGVWSAFFSVGHSDATNPGILSSKCS